MKKTFTNHDSNYLQDKLLFNTHLQRFPTNFTCDDGDGDEAWSILALTTIMSFIKNMLLAEVTSETKNGAKPLNMVGG